MGERKRSVRPAKPTTAPKGPAPKPPRGGKPEWLEHLSVLRLEPGDMLVLRTDKMLSMDQMAHLSRTVESRFPGHQCVVLMPGMELGVVRPSKPPA